jgi:hypothetical protein
MGFHYSPGYRSGSTLYCIDPRRPPKGCRGLSNWSLICRGPNVPAADKEHVRGSGGKHFRSRLTSECPTARREAADRGADHPWAIVRAWGG